MNEFFKKPVVKILMLKGEKGDKGDTGTGTPTGGKTGQYLQKKSDVDYDYKWADITTVQWDKVSGKTNATESSAGLMSAQDKTALDGLKNIQIGSVNLIDGASSEISANYPDTGYIDLIGVKFNVPERTEFVLSFEAMSTVDNDVITAHCAGPNDGIYNESSTGYIGNLNTGDAYVTLSTEWKRYWVKWKRSSVSSTRYFVIGRLTAGKGSGTVSIRKVKLESGNMETDWSPSPNDIYNAINAMNSVTKNFTLSSSSWSSGSYTISDALITATSNQEVLPATSITSDQMKALQKANIIDSGQSAGSLTLKALGTVPSIDIPIRIIFRGKI